MTDRMSVPDRIRTRVAADAPPGSAPDVEARPCPGRRAPPAAMDGGAMMGRVDLLDIEERAADRD